MIEQSVITMTTKKILKNKDNLNFDLCIQRNEVWDVERKSLFIHSLMYGYPIPPIFTQELDNNKLNILDGKQRLTTVLKYINNKFDLHEETPNIEDINVSGKLFKDLPKNLQDEINDFSFTFCNIKNMSDDERDEIFRRLNNGIGLTTYELTRALSRSSTLDIIRTYSQNSFFKNKINITDTARNRYGDEEIIIQCLIYLMDKDISFSSKDIKEFALELKTNGIPKDILDKLNNICDYLDKVFPEYCKYLRKVHISSIVYVADKAIGKCINVDDFRKWLDIMFTKRNKVSVIYSSSCSSGSAKKENVIRRKNEITEQFNKFIEELESKDQDNKNNKENSNVNNDKAS